MKKRLFSAAILAAVVGLSTVPTMATLTNSNTKTDYKTADSTVSVYPALITAAANDTTASALSNVITNLDGSIKDICAAVAATNQTGTSPTLTLSFLGAFAAAGPYFALTTAQGGTAGTTGTMATGALDISTASTTNVATGLCMSTFGRGGLAALLPPYLKVKTAVGGSATPGGTYVVSATVKR